MAKAKASSKKPAKKATAKRAAAGKRTPSGVLLQRADLGRPVAEYFATLPPSQKTIAQTLDKVIRKAAPDAQSSIKWGMAHYVIGRKMSICIYHAKSGVNLGLLHGTHLTDPHSLLEGSGKTMRHVKVTALRLAKSKEVAALVKHQATISRAAAK